jgi:hypothetical protein
VDLSDLGPDTTTIVINWKWQCDDVAPPPFQVASVTECTGCNINISVRVASPGDSASVTQTTQVDASAIVAAVSEATQAATQTVVPPQPPVVSPPAPPQPPVVATPPPASAPGPAPAVAQAPLSEGSPAQAPPDATVVALPPSVVTDTSADDVPRHGAPDLKARSPLRPKARTALHSSARPRVIWEHRVSFSTVVHSISVVHVHTVVRSHEQAARPAGRAPLPFPPPSAPSEPSAFAPATSEALGAGNFTPLALTAGGIGAFLLMFLAYAAPWLRTTRPRPVEAKPHPPG